MNSWPPTPPALAAPPVPRGLPILPRRAGPGLFRETGLVSPGSGELAGSRLFSPAPDAARDSGGQVRAGWCGEGRRHAA